MANLVKSWRGRNIKWTIKCSNILDQPADVLICSANVSLNLTGGVGADLLHRYGTKMQADLHRMIADRSPKAARVGEVFKYRGNEIPYRAILHAVAVDGWYCSSIPVVEQTVQTSLTVAAAMGASRVSLTALATGFGDLSLSQFAEVVGHLFDAEFKPITEVVVCLIEDFRWEELVGSVNSELMR